MRWPASSGMSATLLCIRSRMTALTPFMSASAMSASSEGARAVVSGRIVAATARRLGVGASGGKVPPHRQMGRGTSGAGGGVTGGGAYTPPPPNLRSMVPLPTSCARGEEQLPDVNALFRRQVQLVARLDVERLVPGIDVPDDAVGAVLIRAVRVGQDLLALRILTVLALPRLGEGDEEALVAGEAVDDWRL